MRGKRKLASPARMARIEKVRLRFERWRKSKKGHPPIPAPLWRAAVGLTRHYSVNRISRALGLNNTDLKRRVEAAQASSEARKPSRPTFVELALAESDRQAGCVVEFERPGGERLRIWLPSESSFDLQGLSERFWGMEA